MSSFLIDLQIMKSKLTTLHFISHKVKIFLLSYSAKNNLFFIESFQFESRHEVDDVSKRTPLSPSYGSILSNSIANKDPRPFLYSIFLAFKSSSAFYPLKHTPISKICFHRIQREFSVRIFARLTFRIPEFVPLFCHLTRQANDDHNAILLVASERFRHSQTIQRWLQCEMELVGIEHWVALSTQ